MNVFLNNFSWNSLRLMSCSIYLSLQKITLANTKTYASRKINDLIPPISSSSLWSLCCLQASLMWQWPCLTLHTNQSFRYAPIELMKPYYRLQLPGTHFAMDWWVTMDQEWCSPLECVSNKIPKIQHMPVNTYTCSPLRIICKNGRT